MIRPRTGASSYGRALDLAAEAHDDPALKRIALDIDKDVVERSTTVEARGGADAAKHS